MQDGFLTILDVNAPIPPDDEEPEPLYSTYLGGSNVLRVSGLAVESFVTRGPDRDVIQSVTAYLAGTTGPGFGPSLLLCNRSMVAVLQMPFCLRWESILWNRTRKE